MKKIFTLLLFTFLAFQDINLKAQTDTAFWFATPFISPDNTPRDNYILHVYTYGTAATVRLRQPAAIAPNKYDTTFIVPANTMFDYIFWRDKLATTTNRGFDSLEVQPSDVVLPYGLYISSSAAISVVFDIATRAPLFGNPETFSLKGQNALGLEFLCPFQTNGNNQTLTDLAGTQPGIIQGKQQINIIASKPNTTVWITPKSNIIGHSANVTYSIMLPAIGSAYTVENASQTTTVIANNLTGTSVLADKPIAVTIADDGAKGLAGCYDLTGDQIVPIDEIGVEYVVVKGLMNPSENEGIYVVGTYSNTQVTVNDGVTTTTVINKGDTYFYKLSQSITSVIASKDVYVMHLTGNGCEMSEDVLPPLACSGSSLVAFSRGNTQTFYLSIWCKSGAQSSFTLNNSSTLVPASSFTLVPGTSTLAGGPYYGTKIPFTTTQIPVGSFTIANNTDVFGMGVFNGGATSGSNYHYMTDFPQKTLVSASPSSMPPLCVGGGNTISLSGTISGAAASGTWTTANGTGSFGSYTSTLNTVSTIYTLSNSDTLLSSIKFYLTSIGGCKQFTDSVSIQVIQRPQLITGSSATLCNNAAIPILLTGTVTNALGANWSGGTGFFAPGPNITYTPTTTDLSLSNLILTLTSTGGCTTTAKSLTFAIIPAPTVSATTNASLICAGQQATITASGANTYSWNTASTNTAIIVSPTISTVYTVTGTSNNCSNSFTISQNVSACTSINKNAFASDLLKIYPNPNNGEFVIEANSDLHFRIINELGQIVRTISVPEKKVILKDLSKGIYFITGSANNIFIHEKIVVQ